MLAFKELVIRFLKENPYKSILYFLIICFIYPIESIGIPSLLSKLINSIRTETIIPVFNNYGKTSKEIIMILALVLLFTLVLNTIKNSLEGWFIPYYLSFARRQLITKTIEKSGEDFKEIESGKFVAKILEISRHTKDILHFFLAELVPMCITLIVVCIYFFRIDKSLGYLILTTTVIVIVGLYIFLKPIITISSKRETEYGVFFEKLNENLSNLFNIHINNQVDQEVKKISDVDKKYTNLFHTQMYNTTIVSNLMKLVLTICYISTVFIGYNLLQDNKINKTKYLSALFILTYYVSDMDSLIKHGPRMAIALGGLKMSKSYLLKIFSEKKKENVNNKIKHGKIEFKNISFRYPSSKFNIFEHLNITFPAKKCTTLLGKSGSGKTTIAKMLLGLNKFSEGNILIDDIGINDYNVRHVRNNINYINQKTNLFNENVLYNMSYGHQISESEIIKILEKYDLIKVFSGLEHGIFSSAGVNGSNLSLGMQKVTVLMRGLIKTSKINIIDEPLSGLDKISRKKVIKLINDRCKDTTTLIITHDLEITETCSNIIRMEDIKHV